MTSTNTNVNFVRGTGSGHRLQQGNKHGVHVAFRVMGRYSAWFRHRASGQLPRPPKGAVLSVLLCALFHLPVLADTAIPELGLAHDESLTDRFLGEGLGTIQSVYSPRDYYIEDLADALDYEPLEAFHYLRDVIGFDPYSGSLRGAEGTLAAGTGSVTDRALLLSQLLETQGFETRLAFADLDQATAETVLSSQRPPPSRDELNVTFPKEALGRLTARWKRNESWLRQALSDESLGASVGLSEPETLTTHVWVQARLDGNAWTDLDPSLRDAEPGDVLAAPNRYGKSDGPLAEHRVALALIVETLGTNGLEETVLLSEERPAEALQQTPVFLSFAKTNPTMGGVLASKLQGSVSMKPLLFIGGETLTGDPIPGGGLFTGTEAEEFFSVDSTDAAALYLQVRIILPSGERTDRRRVLFDRVPPGIRAKGGSIDKADLLELPLLNDMPAMFSDVHQILVSTGGLNRHQVMIDLDQALSMASGILASDKPLNAGGLKEALLPVAASNFAWLAGVEQYQATIASQAGEGRWFIDRPRVYLRSVTQRPSPEGLMIGQVIDLLHDDVGVVARAGATADSKAAHRLSYGAMMSAVETVSGEVIAALTPMGGGTALSASMLTSAEPVRLSPGRVGDEDWMSSALANDLDKGLIVLSTDNIEEHHSWWTVDPATGATRSRGYEGISYTLLPRWVRLRLTSFSNKIYRVNAAELNRWAIETSKKAKIVKPKNPTNYRGIFKPRTGSSAADEYLTTVDVGLVLATTVGEGVALAIAFQLLLIMGMITYGVVTGVY